MPAAGYDEDSTDDSEREEQAYGLQVARVKHLLVGVLRRAATLTTRSATAHDLADGVAPSASLEARLCVTRLSVPQLWANLEDGPVSSR